MALLAVSIASALLPPSEDFQPSNTYWNGLEAFFRTANATAIDAAAQRVVPENSVLFVIGPSADVTQLRIEALKAYVLDGGTLVLMDEAGAINPILSALGLGIRVEGHPMLDAVFYYGSWRMPKIIDVRDGLAPEVEEIALNLPSVLEVEGSGVKVLAYSSSFSFLDLDGDGAPSQGEPAGPFAVAVEVAYGKGRILVFSDSSLFLNGVLNLGGNLKLLEKIAAGRSVYVDAGVWQATPQLAYRNSVIAAYRVLSTPEVKYGVALVTVTVIYALAYRVRSYPKGDELEELLRRHPGWDRRLLQAMKEARDKIGE